MITTGFCRTWWTRAGESVIVVATEVHRRALAQRLRTRGFDLDAAREQDLYLPIDAAGALSQFVVDGWPDEAPFRQFVADLMARACANGRRVRVFGELVTLL
jgi:KaiC/GvpD/RAD55 family RecA-like ATPase